MGVTPEFIDEARDGFGAMVKRTYGSTEAPTVTTASWDDPPEKARDTDGHSVGGAEISVVTPGTVQPVYLPWLPICGSGTADFGYHLSSDTPVTVSVPAA